MQVTRFTLSVLVIIGMANVVLADDAKKDRETVTAKAETVKQGKLVDFAGTLGLQFSSMNTLGEKIDTARIASNPVDLAVAAKLLESAETASGKTAEITSESLYEEATNLAKERGNPAELLTIASLVGGDSANDLKAVAKAAEQQQGEEGETTRDLNGDLHIDNHTHSVLHVYVDGHEVGHIYPHGTREFHVHHCYHVVVRDDMGHRWHANFHYGHYHHYDMVIHPPHHHH